MSGEAKMESLPFVVQRIDHIVLRVRDLARSEKFYMSVLGCAVVKKREDLGLTHLKAGASMVDLISVEGKLGSRGGAAAGASGRNVDHFCLRVELFDEKMLIQHLSRFNLNPLGPASQNFGAEGDGPSLYFEDPDANIIELKGPSTYRVKSGT